LKEAIKHIKYFLLILLINVPTACETNVDYVNLPEFKQRLVINSFLSPSDTVSYFYVSTNKKLFGELNSEEPLGKLTGFISDGINEVALDTSSKGLKLGNKSMQITHGTTYKVKVTSESGLSAESTCTIPLKREYQMRLDTFSIVRQLPEGMQSPTGSYYRSIDFKFSFQDVPGEENYYRIASKTIVYYKNPTTQESRKSEYFLSFEKEYDTDKGLDGKNIVFTTIGNYNYFFKSPRDSTIVKIFLYNVEKSYYLYHKSLEDYNDGGNPFSEATPVYSNIDGGLGIFTSYTIDSLILKYK
jgi:hypothetical protein